MTPIMLLAHASSPIYSILQQSVSNIDTGESWRRRYSYSAVALNYLTSAVVMLEAIFFIGLVQQMIFGPKRCALPFQLPEATAPSCKRCLEGRNILLRLQSHGRIGTLLHRLQSHMLRSYLSPIYACLRR